MNIDIQSIKQKMKQAQLFPKKKLGQNFLINSQIIHNILSTIQGLNPTMILEIGPGLGALTEDLITFKKPFCVVEADPILAQYWKNKNVCVLKGSALKIPWHSCLKKGSVLVGNLPYNISGRLLIQLCPGPVELKAMVLMFQKEVAQRILSPPRCSSYGMLSVLSQCFWTPQLVLTAGVSDFYPRPKVAGQTVVFRKKRHTFSQPKKFLAFMKFCFAYRRKILSKKLSQWLVSQKLNPALSPIHERQVSLQEGSSSAKKLKELYIKELLKKMNLSPLARAEELSPSQFVSLFKELEKKGSSSPDVEKT